jgi:hypothetical protein
MYRNQTRLDRPGPQNDKFCIVLVNNNAEEVPMKWAQLRFHFGQKCLAICVGLLTEGTKRNISNANIASKNCVRRNEEISPWGRRLEGQNAGTQGGLRGRVGISSGSADTLRGNDVAAVRSAGLIASQRLG